MDTKWCIKVDWPGWYVGQVHRTAVVWTNGYPIWVILTLDSFLRVVLCHGPFPSTTNSEQVQTLCFTSRVTNILDLRNPRTAKTPLEKHLGHAERLIESNGFGNPNNWKKQEMDHVFLDRQIWVSLTLRLQHCNLAVANPFEGFGFLAAVRQDKVDVFDAAHPYWCVLADFGELRGLDCKL